VDIVTFLRARLDEDTEAVAEFAATVWDAGTEPWAITLEGDTLPFLRITKGRVLREVEAKRRIVDEHAPVQQGFNWTGPHGAPGTERVPDWRCSRCSDCFPDADYDEDTHSSHSWPCLTLRLLALPYADHPDYDPAWAPPNG